MLAKLTFEDGKSIALEDNGKWVSDSYPTAAQSLNMLHRGTFQESRGQAGYWQGHDARRLFGGVLELPERE